MGLVVKEQCWFLFMWFHSLVPCQSYKGYVSRTGRLRFVSRVHWAGLSAPFSNHSCLVVFIQRTPGSHSTGLLSVSSSPPALELLLPAPVYSALLSKPHLHNSTQQLITEKKSQELKWLWCFWPIWGCWKNNKQGRPSGTQSVQMPTRCHCFSARGRFNSIDIWYFLNQILAFNLK